MRRLFSGMQPTGSPHIGNWLGAIQNWVELTKEYDAIYCIVDQHAITIEYDVSEMQNRIHEMAAVLLACGLEPGKNCTLFVQSHVPQHTELAWYLNTVTPMGELHRMTQYKAKADQHKKNVNVGLFDYPVLQSADILLYMGEAVPVGEDQVQHIELSRIVARKFNNAYGEIFPEPMEKITYGARIMGLDGQSKMSKSLNNQIDLIESSEEIWEKLKVAFTDPARQRKTDPGNPDICNIHTLHKHFSSDDEIAWVREGCTSAGIGCFQCKRVLCDNIARALAPIRERSLELLDDRAYVAGKLAEGAERCREMAAETMDKVRKAMGLR